ncbi:hypothetical protein ACK34S_06805, partial [Aeromonas hydrophila]|uniref:hypothetical protein n=1 Tax=Aeromonas hydrophila TaxID=644 RepID=UPI003986E77C
VSMMAALKVMTYLKISLSTHNWDRAFFMAVSKGSVPICAHIPTRHCPTYPIGVTASVAQPRRPL